MHYPHRNQKLTLKAPAVCCCVVVAGRPGLPNCGFKVLVTTIDAQWEGMGDVGSARYEPALLLPCPTIRVLSYSN